MRRGKIITIVLIGMLIFNFFLFYQEESEAIEVDYIVITDSPNGTALDIVNLDFGGTVQAYASGYNSTSGYVGLVEVNWSGNGGNWAPVLGTNSTFTAGTSPGWFTQTAQNASMGVTDTFWVNISSPSIDFLIIRDAPDDGGTVVQNRTYYVGDNEWFYAASYNYTYGFIGDVHGDWWSSNTSVGTITPVPPTPGTAANFEAVGEGTCVINVDYGGKTNVTGTITVIYPNIDYVMIRNYYNGEGMVVGNMLYMINDTDYFYAAGYNNTYGFVKDLDVNWTSDDEAVGNVTSSGIYTMFTAVGHGTCIVTADYGGISNTTGVLTVAQVDYIVIQDGPYNDGFEIGERFYFTWGSGEHYWAAGYNNTHGYVGDVNATWSSNDTGVGNVTSPGEFTYFDPIGDGTCIVTADYNGLTDQTGILTVSSATIDYIQIRNAPGGGGSVMVNQSYVVGEEDIYYGALYNFTSGYIWDVTPYRPPDQGSYWFSSNTSIVTVFTYDSQANITCNDTNTGTVNVTVWAYGVMNSTIINVLSYTIDYISIMDAPLDSGNPIVDTTYCVWDTDTFYAIGYNYTYGYVADVTVDWSSDNPSIGSVTTPGLFTTFSAHWVAADGTCQVTATYNSLTNTTGILTVLAPRADYVQTRDAPNGMGAIITTIGYQRGDTDTYYGAAYNYTVNFMGSVPLTSTWTSTNASIVSVTSPGNSSTISCDNNNWGVVTVTLDDGLGHTFVTTVTVLSFNVDYILIRDSPNGGGIDLSDPANYPSYPVGHTTTFYGAMYNNSAGYLIDVASTSIWTSSNTDIVDVTYPGASSVITCSNTNYGTVTVTLFEWMGYSATTEVTVLKPTIDYLQIVDTPNAGIDSVDDTFYILGDSDLFYAAAFNNTAGYFEDVHVDWSSSDTGVGTVTTPGTTTNFSAEGTGTCIVTADYGGGITDTTGTLTVSLPTNITVDDSGGGYFTSIQDAIDFASEGNTVYVLAGIYFENLIVNKSIILMGEDKTTVIIDGGGNGTVIHVSADDVDISGFTIQNGEYGIYNDETDSILITYNIIRDYETGLYNYKTTGGWVTYNQIKFGEYGIVTYLAHNDAIRYNTISYNTVYGAKDYDSQLKNCFNWNYFHHNHIAYYYDPDIPLDVLEFDGNLLEDNYIAIMVENASTITITNNTMIRNEYGIYLINASPNISENTITTAKYGIYSEDSAPRVVNNELSDISEYGIYAQSGDSFEIMNNSVTDSKMIFFDSTIKELWLLDSDIITVNTNVENIHLDETSSREVGWYLDITVIDSKEKPVEGAVVLVYDVHEALIATMATDLEGRSDEILVIETRVTASSTITYNPYRIEARKGSLKESSEVTIEDNTQVVIVLSGGGAKVGPFGSMFFWSMLIMVGFIGAIGVSALCIEGMKYGMLTLFLPLYTRIKKSRVLDQPTRYKIIGYIIGNPGAHFGLIKHELELGNGQLTDHLRQLTNNHLIYSKEDGLKKRFYPIGFPKSQSITNPLSNIQDKILTVIKENTGITQKKVASFIGMSRQVAGYHLMKLERDGVIEKEVVGRERRYYPCQPLGI